MGGCGYLAVMSVYRLSDCGAISGGRGCRCQSLGQDVGVRAQGLDVGSHLLLVGEAPLDEHLDL